MSIENDTPYQSQRLESDDLDIRFYRDSVSSVYHTLGSIIEGKAREDRKMEETRYGLDELVKKDSVYEKMRDIQVILGKYAKDPRFIENWTTNLAKCFISIHAKFDSGKHG